MSDDAPEGGPPERPVGARDVVLSVVIGVALFAFCLLVVAWGSWQSHRRGGPEVLRDVRGRFVALGDPASEELQGAALEALRVHRVPSLWPREARDRTAAAPQGALWVDVRARAEFAVSHLPGALLWADGRGEPPREVANAAATHRPIVVYCSIGRRSGAAVERLRRALPAADAHNLLGGAFLWAEQGFPLEGGATVHPYDATWGRLLRPDLRYDPSARGLDGDAGP